MSQSREAFVIIPFTPEFDEIYEEAIKPICQGLGYDVSKADSTDTQQNILRDVIGGISNADLLVADLTNSNPNVFYEAGVSHALGVPTILITQDISSVPFDLQAYQMIEYSTHFADMDDFKSDLERIAESHLSGRVEFGSPVSDFSEVTIDVPDSSGEADGVAGTSGGEGPEPEPVEPNKGVLDYATEAEDAQTHFVDSVFEITDRTNVLQANLTDHGDRVTAITGSNDNISPRRVNKVAKTAANDIRDYVNSVSKEAESVEESLKTMMDAQEGAIDFADPTIEADREALRERQTELGDFRSAIQMAISGLEDFYYEADQVRGLSRGLNQAIDELTAFLSDLISTLTSSDARAERMVQLIDQKLDRTPEFSK